MTIIDKSFNQFQNSSNDYFLRVVSVKTEKGTTETRIRAESKWNIITLLCLWIFDNSSYKMENVINALKSANLKIDEKDSLSNHFFKLESSFSKNHSQLVDAMKKVCLTCPITEDNWVDIIKFVPLETRSKMKRINKSFAKIIEHSCNKAEKKELHLWSLLKNGTVMKVGYQMLSLYGNNIPQEITKKLKYYDYQIGDRPCPHRMHSMLIHLYHAIESASAISDLSNWKTIPFLYYLESIVENIHNTCIDNTTAFYEYKQHNLPQYFQESDVQKQVLEIKSTLENYINILRHT